MLKRGLTLACLFLMTLTMSTPWAKSQQDADVPAYNEDPPSKDAKLPAILSKDQLGIDEAPEAYQTHAYELAAKIPEVIHQQPCYCYCDRNMGHKSLHSCFEGKHAAECSTCLKELYYSYSMHKRGKTAAEIRQGIIRGEWRQIDLKTAASIN
ncbi:MAG: CYCXC family (seleno)protein [Terriglobales bacterium]